MGRLMQAALLSALAVASLSGTAAKAADLDYQYAPPERAYTPPPPPEYAPPVVYAPRVVEELPPVVYPRPYAYRRPYGYPAPYAYARRFPPYGNGEYRRFAYGPRYRGDYAPGWYR